MLKVNQLLKFISDLNPQNTPTRLCFYNFLKGFPFPEDDLTPELIENFFCYCMDYPHWASNKQQLGNEIHFLLENFNRLYQKKFDLSAVRFPQQVQLVEMENFSDIIDAVSLYLKSQYGEEDKVRLLPDQNKRLIAIILRANKSLEVRTFDRKFVVRGGALRPLRDDLILYYTPSLELSPQHTHKVEVAPYITAKFTIFDEKVTGAFIRGYVFQKFADFKNEKLSEQTRLLFPIKRIEQFFVDRRTDPYYQDLITQLERTGALVQQGDEEALKWAPVVLGKAETALENVFMADKLMTLLVRDLRHATLEFSRKNISSTGFSSAITPIQQLPEAEEECLKIMPLKEFDLTN